MANIDSGQCRLIDSRGKGGQQGALLVEEEGSRYGYNGGLSKEGREHRTVERRG
jgi:hypothetical protein